MACAVSQRTPEIGIRLALGAQQRDVQKLILGEGIRLALSGVAVGLAGAVALTRLLKSFDLCMWILKTTAGRKRGVEKKPGRCPFFYPPFSASLTGSQTTCTGGKVCCST